MSKIIFQVLFEYNFFKKSSSELEEEDGPEKVNQRVKI